MTLKYSKEKQVGKSRVKLSLPKLDAKLWRIFSKYTRIRDIVGDSERCQCITCKKYYHWKEIDAGHFISRRFKATKFNEQNVNGQCKKCNRFQNGNQFQHGYEIDKKYGSGTALKIYELSGVRVKLTREWYEDQIIVFKHRLQQIANIKKISIK